MRPTIANPAAAMMQGMAYGQQMKDMKRQNALYDLYQQHGAGIASGDPNALNALAQYDPMAAREVQVQNSRLEMARQQEARLAKKFELDVAQYAQSLDAAAAKAEAEQIRQGLFAAASAQTPEQWDALANQFGVPDLVGQFENRQAYLNRYSTAAEILEQQAGPKPADEYGRYRAEEIEAGREPLSRIDYAQAKKGKGFSVKTPDGTVVQYGGGQPQVPGQMSSATGTPRDPGKLSKELSKGDAGELDALRLDARNAADLESLAKQLEAVAPQIGYTGPGGGIYGAIDDAVGILPGDSGARGAFRSLGMEAQLTFTEKTKGAITDREMAMFRQAVPNLGQRPEANQMIAQVMQAGANRIQTRAAFFENWARKYGSLEGAQEVWSEYMDDNPIMSDEGGDLRILPEGEWIGYLNRKPANSYTPQAISGMTQEDLSMIPIERMTSAQLDAIERRMQQLGMMGQ